jgi:hypothetical protein
MGLLDHMADLCLVFKKPPYSFPEWLHQFAFPPAVYEGSFFLKSLPTPIIGGVFDDSYSNRGEMEFLWPEMVSIFHVFFGHLNFFF